VAFNSIQFLVFFPIVLALYYASPARYRWALLLAASLYSCGSGAPIFILPLLATTAVTYVCALSIAGASNAKSKRRQLELGLVALLGTLLVFKYFNFFNDNLRALFTALGLPYGIRNLNLFLPLGISFYTLQQISYLVDVYRGKVEPERHFGLLALYVAFFPRFVAGPIERAGSLLPQLRVAQPFAYGELVAGLQLAALGFFKKVVVADRLAPFVEQVYHNPQAHDGVAVTFATLLFAVQIYCDFSGYTDIALGVAQCMGYKLTPNFKQPYYATSIQDFWKRWHISLSNFLTDYVFTPVTRQRLIKVKFYYLMLGGLVFTFLVSGLWHGAEWTFVAWGLLHGSYLLMSTITRDWRARVTKRIKLNESPRLQRAWRIAFTFSLVCFAYILFNARTMSEAFYLIRHLPTGWTHPAAGVKEVLQGRHAEFVFALLGTAVVMVTDFLQNQGPVRQRLAARPTWMRWGVYYACAVSIILLGAFYETNQKFIYFQF